MNSQGNGPKAEGPGAVKFDVPVAVVTLVAERAGRKNSSSKTLFAIRPVIPRPVTGPIGRHLQRTYALALFLAVIAGTQNRACVPQPWPFYGFARGPARGVRNI